MGHFTEISSVYNQVRTTDSEPVCFVREQLSDRSWVLGADVGTGTGRYPYLLLQKIKGLHLTCVDYNLAMLRQASYHLRSLADRVNLVRADSGRMPFADESFDCMTAFNSIHHFDSSSFLNEAARLLKYGSRLFVYTRLRAQNERNVWGKFFPDFTVVERRLYDLSQLRELVAGVKSLTFESVEYFDYARQAHLERLVALAKSHHYSTFALYGADHFQWALQQFKRNIQRAFPNTKRIPWTDENALLVIQKRKASSS